MIFLSKAMLCFMMYFFQFHKYVLYRFCCQIHFLPQCVQTDFKSTALIFLNCKDLKVAEKLQVQYKEIIFPKPYENELPNLCSNTYRYLMYFLYTGSSLT